MDLENGVRHSSKNRNSSAGGSDMHSDQLTTPNQGSQWSQQHIVEAHEVKYLDPNPTPAVGAEDLIKIQNVIEKLKNMKNKMESYD